MGSGVAPDSERVEVHKWRGKIFKEVMLCDRGRCEPGKAMIFKDVVHWMLLMASFVTLSLWHIAQTVRIHPMLKRFRRISMVLYVSVVEERPKPSFWQGKETSF